MANTARWSLWPLFSRSAPAADSSGRSSGQASLGRDSKRTPRYLGLRRCVQRAQEQEHADNLECNQQRCRAQRGRYPEARDR